MLDSVTLLRYVLGMLHNCERGRGAPEGGPGAALKRPLSRCDEDAVLDRRNDGTAAADSALTTCS